MVARKKWRPATKAGRRRGGTSEIDSEGELSKARCLEPGGQPEGGVGVVGDRALQGLVHLHRTLLVEQVVDRQLHAQVATALERKDVAQAGVERVGPRHAAVSAAGRVLVDTFARNIRVTVLHAGEIAVVVGGVVRIAYAEAGDRAAGPDVRVGADLPV